MSRFVVVLSALLCALVIGLGSGSLALAQSSSRVPTAEDQDVIRLVMTEENAGWTAETKYLLKAFEIANPIYRVELIIRKEDGFAKSIRELVARGEAPHLILGPSTEIAGLYQTGHLSTQSPRNLNRALGAGAFLPGPLQVFRAGPQKELFGLPYHGWVQAIWYRKSWFQALKLEPPTTIGALVRAAETIKKAQHGIYGIVMGKEADVYGEQSFSMIALSLGLRVVDAEGVPNLNTPEFIGALKIFKRLIDTSPPEANSPVGRDYYFQDRVGMIVYSSHIMDDLALSSAAARSLTGDNYSDLEGKPFNPNLLPDTGIVSALEGIEKAAFGSVVGIA
ncbi:MAG: ABC transporter substrate-binding protein, partial [Rhodospirillaceae bacterium]